MQFQEIKRDYLRSRVSGDAYDVSMVPQRIVARWDKIWTDVPEMNAIPVNPRLMNRYSMGADPELSLMDALGGYADATNFKMDAGRAFGADNNGRLVELRPTPSRFALDIVASVLAELQWMARIKPKTLEYNWCALPYDKRDGQGGHVHFARKRNADARKDDVKGLDSLFAMLMHSGVFDSKLCQERIGRAKYGAYGDIRIQKHGYEYRSFPTWLTSPWMAYLVLALSKIAVHEPRFVNDIYQKKDVIPNLLRLYQNADDDIRIAAIAYRRYGLPKHGGIDFKKLWGINQLFGENPKYKWYPPMIVPTEEHRKAIFEYLVNGTAVPFIKGDPNWVGYDYPGTYSSLFHFNTSLRRPGIGEICSNLVCHMDLPTTLHCVDERIGRANEAVQMFVPMAYKPITEVVCEFNRKLPDTPLHVHRKNTHRFDLYLPKDVRSALKVDLVRDWLASGLFPLWESHLVTENSLKEWREKYIGQHEFRGSEVKL